MCDCKFPTGGYTGSSRFQDGQQLEFIDEWCNGDDFAGMEMGNHSTDSNPRSMWWGTDIHYISGSPPNFPLLRSECWTLHKLGCVESNNHPCWSIMGGTRPRLIWSILPHKKGAKLSELFHKGKQWLPATVIKEEEEQKKEADSTPAKCIHCQKKPQSDYTDSQACKECHTKYYAHCHGCEHDMLKTKLRWVTAGGGCAWACAKCDIKCPNCKMRSVAYEGEYCTDQCEQEAIAKVKEQEKKTLGIVISRCQCCQEETAMGTWCDDECKKKYLQMVIDRQLEDTKQQRIVSRLQREQEMLDLFPCQRCCKGMGVNKKFCSTGCETADANQKQKNAARDASEQKKKETTVLRCPQCGKVLNEGKSYCDKTCEETAKIVATVAKRLKEEKEVKKRPNPNPKLEPEPEWVSKAPGPNFGLTRAQINSRKTIEALQVIGDKRPSAATMTTGAELKRGKRFKKLV